MYKIRDFIATDSQAVGQLIADTYTRFNLDSIDSNEIDLYLGPFQHADSSNLEHQDAIADILRADIILVAEHESGEIIGVLRGRPARLHSLFVDGNFHLQGVGTALLQHFEAYCLKCGCNVIRLASTLYAIPFYLRMGYFKSTGVRRGWSFQGEGMLWQPMKKILK